MSKPIGQGVPFERIRRITGYLVGTMEKWNDAKKAEERERVKHSTAMATKATRDGAQVWIMDDEAIVKLHDEFEWRDGKAYWQGLEVVEDRTV